MVSKISKNDLHGVGFEPTPSYEDQKTHKRPPVNWREPGGLSLFFSRGKPFA